MFECESLIMCFVHRAWKKGVEFGIILFPSLSTRVLANKLRIITKPPGYMFISLAKLLLTKKAYSRIMEPAILMMQEEYFDYFQNGETKRAFFVKFRFNFIFLQILGLNLPVIKQFLEIQDKIAK